MYILSLFLETRTPDGDILQRSEMFQIKFEDKEPGMFISDPNLVYQCITSNLIKPNEDLKDLRYVLTIYLPDREESIMAESLMPPLPANIRPALDKDPYALYLYDLNEPLIISWRRSLDFYIQLQTKVNFLELRNGQWQPAFVTHTRKFNHWDRPPIDPTEEVVIRGEWLFFMMGGRINNDPEVSSRKFVSIDFQLITSDPLFYDYFAYEHYLTDLTTNTFTNIIGGIGIFAAYNKADWKGYTIDRRSMDSLAMGRHTKDLKFTRW